MSAFLTYEGTSDFIAATPYLAVTLAASGSITAGRAAAIDGNNPGYVYQPSGIINGAAKPAGVALTTAADATGCSIMVWGYAKSLPALAAATSFSFGEALVITGSGYWGHSGSTASVTTGYIAGKIVSGSAGYIYAFIDCMSNP